MDYAGVERLYAGIAHQAAEDYRNAKVHIIKAEGTAKKYNKHYLSAASKVKAKHAEKVFEHAKGEKKQRPLSERIYKKARTRSTFVEHYRKTRRLTDKVRILRKQLSYKKTAADVIKDAITMLNDARGFFLNDPYGYIVREEGERYLAEMWKENPMWFNGDKIIWGRPRKTDSVKFVELHEIEHYKPTRTWVEIADIKDLELGERI